MKAPPLMIRIIKASLNNPLMKYILIVSSEQCNKIQKIFYTTTPPPRQILLSYKTIDWPDAVRIGFSKITSALCAKPSFAQFILQGKNSP